MKPIIDRILEKIKKQDNGCWTWLGMKDKDGYGRIKINYKLYMVHRIIYELYKGNFDKSKLICHKCNNPSCVNPDHLYCGTHKENMFDKVRAGTVKGSKHPKP